MAPELEPGEWAPERGSAASENISCKDTKDTASL